MRSVQNLIDIQQKCMNYEGALDGRYETNSKGGLIFIWPTKHYFVTILTTLLTFSCMLRTTLSCF